MAKTAQQIFDIMKAEMVSFPELAALTSTVNNMQELLIQLTTDSRVSNHDLILWIQAVANHYTEVEVEHTLTLVMEALEQRKYGTAGWYVAMAKAFQLGDTVVWGNDMQFNYDPIDTSVRIVKHAAVVPITQGIRLKVAKDNSGTLGPVSGPELTALDSYFNDEVIGIKPAGVQLIITTGNPDLLKMTLRVVRHPQVMASDGSLLADSGVFPVEDAINNYIQFLPFNGELNLTKLEDAIQAAEGVVDVEIDSAEYKYGTFPYAAIDLQYKPDAGYAVIDPLFPLASSITYQL